MIHLQNVTKTYHLGNSHKTVANNITFSFPSGISIGLLGRNGAGKSTLLKMIAGTMDPDHGRITSEGSISYPVGFAGSFHPDLTGAQNTRFVARIYGVNTDLLSNFVEDFAELGNHFHHPFRTYSSGMRSRLAFGVSMGIPFDTYLVDEVTSVGDAAFRAKSSALFKERMKKSGALVVSHSTEMLQALCQAGAVLEDGNLYYYAEVDTAIIHHNALMRGTQPPWVLKRRKDRRLRMEAAAKAAQEALN